MADVRPYIVRQGDYLTEIASVVGGNEADIWEATQNQSLRDAGRTRSLLAPGDVLYVPDEPRAAIPLVQGGDNRLTGVVPRTTVELRFEDADGPCAGWACRIEGPFGEPREVATGPGGELSVEVSVTVRAFDVVIDRVGARVRVQVGALDPVEESSGVRDRLANLGLCAARGDLSGDGVLGGLGFRLSEDDAGAALEEGWKRFRERYGGSGEGSPEERIDALRLAYGF